MSWNMQKTIAGFISLVLLALAGGYRMGAHTAGLPAARGQEEADQERVAKLKQTLLGRIKRDKVTYRGDKPGEIRIRWEWHNQVVNNYIYQKRLLLSELSANDKYEVRPIWAFKDMRVTFQEVFQLGAEDDDKLLPILAHSAAAEMAPQSSFEGLTILGKQGEVKGPFIRKYKARQYVSTGYVLYYIGLSDRLEYKSREGKPSLASGIAPDAITLRWKDIKDRVFDYVSQAKLMEDLAMERDALFPDEDSKKP